MLVLLVVLGAVLFVHSRSTADTAATPAAGTTVAVPSTTSAPPLPSSVVPSPSSPAPSTPPPSTAPLSTTTRPAPPTSSPGANSGTPAGPADVSAITALSQQLIDALNSGDAKKIQGLTCGKLRTQADEGAQPVKKKITYDRTEDVTVDGDTGSAQVYATNDDSKPSPATMQVQRVNGAWKACNLR